MLNEERKQVFLNQNRFETFESGSMINITKTINIFGNYEDVCGKDICDWSIADIKEALISVNSKSIGSVRNYISHMKYYTDWCIKNGLSKINQNNYSNITMQMMNEVVNSALLEKQLITREYLLERMEPLLNSRDKFLLLALYEGIGGAKLCEIVEMKRKDINHDTKTVLLCTGRNFKMSDQLYDFAVDSASSTDYYVRRNSTKTEDGIIVYKRNEDDLESVYWALQKGIIDDNKHRGIIQSIKRVNKSIGLQTMTTRAYNRAGRYWYIKKIADKEGISVLECEKKHEEEINKIYGAMSIATKYNWYEFLKQLE